VVVLYGTEMEKVDRKKVNEHTSAITVIDLTKYRSAFAPLRLVEGAGGDRPVVTELTAIR
jgi:hypothetical protein